MKKRNLAFTVELLGLFILLLLVITVITRVFVMSRAHSLEAKRLTEAVTMAENTAEICSTEAEIAMLADKFKGLDTVSTTELTADGEGAADGEIWFTESFDGSDNQNKQYVIHVERMCSDTGKGVYADDHISIYGSEAAEEPIYTLDTGKYFGEGK